MNNVDIKAGFITDMNKYFDILNRLLLHLNHKLLIILKYIYSEKYNGDFLSVTLQVTALYIM